MNKLTIVRVMADNAILRAKQSKLKERNSKLMYKMEADKKAFVATLATLRFLQNKCLVDLSDIATLRFLQNECSADLSDIENHEAPNGR